MTLSENETDTLPELTKRYETICSTTISDAVSNYSNQEPKGEFVLIIQGKSIQEIKEAKQREWNSIPLKEHMEHYEIQGISHKEAMKLVAKDRGISKRDVYAMLLDESS